VAEDEAMAIRILALSVLLAALVGCANAPPTRAGNTAAQPQPMLAARDALNCAPPQAASRIPPDPRHCPAGAGNVRTYTGEQLEQTGATQVGDALHYLDPEISITHH
jgi:hypothetical protein